MKILVTGGSGFIGRNFIENYGSKFEIIAPSMREMNLAKIEDVKAIFEKHNFDAVVHLAERNESKVKTLIDADNLIFFKNIQYASIINGVKKLLIVGDSAVFCKDKTLVDVQEDDAFNSSNVPPQGYAQARYLIETLANKDKISTVLRLFNAYGRYGNAESSNLMKVIHKAIRSDNGFKLKRDKIISAIYVEDAAKIIAAFLNNDYAKGIYNVASTTKTSYLDAIKAVRKAMKRDSKTYKINVLENESEPELTASCEKLMSVLGSFKFTSINTGVAKTL